MLRISLILCLIPAASCSLLFTTSTDMDAGLAAADARTSTCTTPFASTGFVGLAYGSVVNFDLSGADALDDVLLHALPIDAAPRTFLSTAGCELGSEWAYTKEWAPKVVGEDLAVRSAVYVKDKDGASNLVALGAVADTGWLAAFPLDPDVSAVSETPGVTRLLPDIPLGTTCDPASAQDFEILAGNFDGTGFLNDVALNTNVVFEYEVDRWTDEADEWDQICNETTMELQGFVPRRRGGQSGVWGLGRVVDEGLPVHGILNWNSDGAVLYMAGKVYDGGTAQVRGTAMARDIKVGDGKIHSVGWRENGTTVDLTTISVGEDEAGEPKLIAATGQVNPSSDKRPDDGVIVDDANGKRFLLLLVGVEILAIEVDEPTLPVVSVKALALPQKFLLAPNWGPDKQRVLLSFQEDGAYSCFSFLDGQLEPC